MQSKKQTGVNFTKPLGIFAWSYFGKIAEGEKNVMRLIHLLEQQERKSVLSFDDQAKTYR